MRLSSRNFCSSSVSPDPSSTRAPANGRTLKATGAANFDGFGERHRAAVEGELAGAVGHPADLLVELGDTGQTRSRDRLVGRGDDAS